MLIPMTEKEVVSLHSPGNAERAYYIAGIVSVILYGSFFIWSLWRCYVAFPRFKRSFENKKMIIHATLTCFGFCQTIYGVSFIQHKRDTVWGYSFHMIGQFSVLTSFALIPLIWTKILSYGGNYRAVRIHIAVVLVSNFVITMIQIGLLIKTNDVYDSGLFEEMVTILRALIISLSLLSFSVWLLAYGVRIYMFLSSSKVRSNDIIRNERRKAIQRVIFVVLACSVCYMLRAFCVTLITYDYFRNEYYTEIWFSHLGWYLCSQWIPTLIPAYIMLHVCRPVPRVKNSGNHELRLRSESTVYGAEDGHFVDRPSTDSADDNMFRSSYPIAFGAEYQRSTNNTSTSPPVSNRVDDFSRFGENFVRYSNDMYNDEDIESYDYDPEDDIGSSTPGKPFTIDEILRSSNIYGASTSPFEEHSTNSEEK